MRRSSSAGPLDGIANATRRAAPLAGVLVLVAGATAMAHSAGRLLAANARAKLYATAQAEQGQQVFSQDCASCHGAQGQGASAPGIVGTPFLNKAKLLGWSVDNLREVVVSTMPRNNPGSLSPQQYADVLAYLLAADCLPAGNSQFPAKSTPALKSTPLQRPGGVSPDDQKSGTCTLHDNG